MHRHLALFGKPPEPGRVKTRLCPPLTPVAAEGLSRAFLLDICARPLPIDVVVEPYVEPPFDADRMQELARPRVGLRSQADDGLASRKVAAIGDTFERGARYVVLRNADSPLLPVASEVEAFQRLAAGAEIVLGPDCCGGYYLVGWRQPQPDLFLGLPMSVPSNFERTRQRAEQSTPRVEVLARQTDVDTCADPLRLAESLRSDGEARRLAPRTAEVVAHLERSGALTSASLAAGPGLRDDR